MTHTYGDQQLVDWHNTDGNEYDENHDEEAKELCKGLLNDLTNESTALKNAVQQNDFVYATDVSLGKDLLSWNVDLVIGTPEDDHAPDSGWMEVGSGTEIDEVLMAADVKSVMSSHTNNRKNRVRVLLSLGLHVKEIWANEPGDNPPMHDDAMAAGLVVMNTADKFDYGDRVTPNPSTVGKTTRLTGEGLSLAVETSSMVDGLTIVPIDYEGQGSTASLRTDSITPSPGDPAHYKTFAKSLAETFEDRFLTRSATTDE